MTFPIGFDPYKEMTHPAKLIANTGVIMLLNKPN